MVGVPGKYKGCETCRRRRVKCSNERPFCQKCIASGRECEGYERERVFITGTPESKGRVASHPRKASAAKKQKTTAEAKATPELVPLHPLTSAWDDHTVLSSHGIEYSVLITALHTTLEAVSRHDSVDEDVAGFRMLLPPYAPTELQPQTAREDLNVSGQCLARLPGTDEGDDAESYCVFLFQNNTFVNTPWHVGPEQMGEVRRLGPAHFTSFPNHHYFVRVYRSLAVSHALLSRRETFLSAPDWTTIPWTDHPKCLVDQLFDLILFLPSIFNRADSLKPLEPTLSRRHMAQELLQTCLTLEQHFGSWLRLASQGSQDQPFAYWAEELTSPGGLIPFSNSYTFRDGVTGLRFLYFWMSQILFHGCIESLHRIIFQPVIDAYPNMWPDLPPNLQIDITRYQHGRAFAADICRGLDSALDSSVQPDMLVAPMTVAMDLYKEINMSSPDGAMEIMWLENFRIRLIGKGQHISDVLQKQRWTEVATF